jgi:glycerol-3-phosphate acyltransferase PlsX
MRLLRGPPGVRAQAAQRAGAGVAAVAVDVLGADRGVPEVVAGACRAAQNGSACVLFGPAAEITPALGGTAPPGIEVEDAPQGISNREDPVHGVRSKPDASIVRAARAVGEGRARALVSAGSTGAALAAGLLNVKRLRGVLRPALAVLVPVPGRPVLMLDAGATLEVRAEQLVQFAFMGAAFSAAVLGTERPRVGLLSVGEEPEKGTPQVVAAHERLAVLAQPPFEFAGNVEGGDIPGAQVDVVVTDGFTGNVALKVMEGTSRTVAAAIRSAIESGALSRVGGLLIRSRVARLRAELDPENVGGAYLLGLRGLIVVAHGSSSSRAIASAIALAERGIEQDVTGRLAAALAAAGVLRGGEADAAPASAPADSFRAVP